MLEPVPVLQSSLGPSISTYGCTAFYPAIRQVMANAKNFHLETIMNICVKCFPVFNMQPELRIRCRS